MAITKDSKVLVVDDSSAVRTIVKKLLGQLGYSEVDEAANGVEALAKIYAKPYSLVISDWNMEPMNGRVLLDRVRKNPKYAKLPFIMMTAESDAEKVAEAKYGGVNSFINKPFNAEALQGKIAQIKAE